MRLQVKVNVPLDIRMCLECPFYEDYYYPTCYANKYLNIKHKSNSTINLDLDELETVPDICPLLKLEEK